MRPGPNPLENLESKSTVCKKLGPEDRKKLGRATMDRSHPTHRACYEHFRLADRGIGFFAFYRYARRFRAQAAARIAELTRPHAPQADVVQSLVHALARRLIRAACDDSVSPETIERLARAYRIIIRSQDDVRRAVPTRREAAHDRFQDARRGIGPQRQRPCRNVSQKVAREREEIETKTRA